MHYTAGLILSVVFQLAHVVEGNYKSYTKRIRRNGQYLGPFTSVTTTNFKTRL
jgi:hypothetical protein